MTITLPDEMRESLEARAKAAGYESVDELVEDAMQTEEVFAGIHEPAVQKRLAALIEEGLASGPTVPVTPEFWDRLHARVAERLDAKGVAK